MSSPETILATELQTYADHKEELLQHHEGRYALVKGATVHGTFDTKQDAVTAGLLQFGTEPFLVKRLVRVERPVRILLPRG